MNIKINNLILSLIVCVIAIQVTAFLAVFLGPASINEGLQAQVLPEWAGTIRPKWDLILFIVFVCLAIGGQLIASYILGKKQKDKDLGRGALTYLLVEAALTFLIVSAAFQMTIYDNSPFLAKKALIVLAIVSLVLKIFWREIAAFMLKTDNWLLQAEVSVALRPIGNILTLIVIAALIYLPDLERVVAQFFIGEQFHHFDFFLMSPGWAYLNGGLPFVDVISQYGVGVVACLSRLTAFFGGFDYIPALRMFMFLVIIYYFLAFGFVRYWLGSVTLGLIVFLLAFRLQMFHYGVSPLCWTYPSTTPIRFGFDILWLGLLLAHLRTGRIVFLVLAAIYSGAALYYMTATGACIIATFLFYIASLVVTPHLRRQYFPSAKHLILAFFCAALSLISAFCLFWLTLGSHVFKAVFWHNMIEYLTFFAHGHAGGVLPMYEGLKYRYLWVAVMAFGLPLFYLGTALFVGGLVYLKRIRAEHIIAVVIAIYGLANYQYFVVRSAATSYYMNALPFVLLTVYWFSLLIKRLDDKKRRRLRWVALALSLYALTTNHNYISYPNIFNFSRNPMVDITVAQRYPDRQGYFNHQVKNIKEADKLEFNSLGETFEDIRTEDSFKSDEELKDYYRRESDFSKDAALIKSLTSQKQKVPILSSFETKILIQSSRAPFFYHTPLISSQPMRMRFYPADAAHSPNYLADTIRQLENSKPPYVFMERVFLQENIPEAYRQSNGNIIAIVGYIRSNYTADAVGQYLIAMKRKNN